MKPYTSGMVQPKISDHYSRLIPVLGRGSIDKPLTFDVGWIYTTQLSYQCVHLIHATLQSNCAKGLHFSAFDRCFTTCTTTIIINAKCAGTMSWLLALVRYNSVFVPLCSPNTCKGVFNPSVTKFLSNCAEGLHFSAFHYNFYYYSSSFYFFTIIVVIIIIIIFIIIIIIIIIIIVVVVVIVIIIYTCTFFPLISEWGGV